MSKTSSNNHLRRLKVESGALPLEKIAHSPLPEAEVEKIKNREGVFVHTFKCGGCFLEFAIYSWFAGKHRLDSVACPECGARPFLHRRALVSETVKFGQRPKDEICSISEWPTDEVVEQDPSANTYRNSA